MFFAEVGINEVLDSGAFAAQSIADSWEQQWLDILQNNTGENLYGSLNRLGIFFAVGTLLFFMIQWLKDVISSELSRPIYSLIWPFLVVALLANVDNGTTLSNLCLGVRDFLNGINQQVVTITDRNQNYQQALNLSIAEEVADSFFRPCQSLTGNLR